MLPSSPSPSASERGPPPPPRPPPPLLVPFSKEKSDHSQLDYHIKKTHVFADIGVKTVAQGVVVGNHCSEVGVSFISYIHGVAIPI